MKEFIGHRSIETTLRYIQLEQALYKETNDEFTVKVTKDPEEIKELLEIGFEYVCHNDDLIFLRKRR